MQRLSSISNPHDNVKSSVPVFAQNKQSTFFKPSIQPKFTINQSNDILEQEADAVADKVMRMTNNESTQQRFFKPAISSVQRKCEHCEEEKMQRKEISDEEKIADNELENYISTLEGGGNSLSKKVRSFFEPRFGYDFSNVKVHTDAVAANSAQSINALAYTSESNMVFNKGQYQPETNTGKRLLAHELTHVVQQQSAVNRKTIQRQATASATTPTYGSACSGGATDPCQYSRCNGRHDGIMGDLLRASDYTLRTVEALAQSPLSDSTTRALDWYFNDHSQATTDEVAPSFAMHCSMPYRYIQE